MILNIRVDHKIADIQSMEHISKEIDDLFDKLQEKYSINEYVEISTCNRKEYYIHNENIAFDDELLSHENKSIIIEYGGASVMHLLAVGAIYGIFHLQYNIDSAYSPLLANG